MQQNCDRTNIIFPLYVQYTFMTGKLLRFSEEAGNIAILAGIFCCVKMFEGYAESRPSHLLRGAAH